MKRVILACACAALLGACGKAPNSAPAADTATAGGDWAANINGMLPYIDACLAKSPDTRWISYAAVAEGSGVVTVRLSGAPGAFDCTAPEHDPEAVQIAPRNAELSFEGEGAAIFVRAPGENPGGECYAAPEVRGANDELLGWMADPDGC